MGLTRLHRCTYADLVVASDLPLPELPRAPASSVAADITVRISPDPVVPADIAPQWRHDWIDADEVSLSGVRVSERYGLTFPGVAEAWFTLDGEISLWRHPDASVESLRHVLLDQVLPRLIAQRGHLVLHGSMASTADGRTVVVLGNSGMGKSTLASGIALSGGNVLTDDCLIVAIDAGQGAVRAVPSYPGLRLWPDSLTALFDDRRAQATPMTHYSDKVRLPPPSTPAGGGPAVRIDAVLVLQHAEADEKISIVPLAPQQACMALIGNSFQLDLGNLRHTHTLLNLAATLAGHVPILALSYPRDYAALPDVVECIRTTLDLRAVA